MNRAYSLLDVKSIDEDKRIIRGVATTPGVDRVGDIIEPLGVSFKNPLPLLWQHQHDKPIGTVKFDRPTKAGITFEAELPAVAEEGTLKSRIDEAWQSIKLGLVKAVSIGFRPIEYAFMDEGGIRFIKTEVFELSAVTIPANAEAVITGAKSLNLSVIAEIKKFDTNAPAATGHIQRSANNRPASGRSSLTYRPKEGTQMKNIGARIAELEELRKAKATQMTDIQTKALEAGRSKDQQEQADFDKLRDEIGTLDAEIKDLRDVEALTVAPTIKTIDKDGNRDRLAPLPAAPAKKAAPGIRLAQLIKARTVSQLDVVPMVNVVERMYGRDSEIFAIVKAGEQVPGSNASGNWAADLVSAEGGIVADFAEYLRPATIIGKFGQGSIPALRNVPFRRPLVIGTGGGQGYWVGEGKPKPLTQFDFDRTTMAPLKCATIAVLTMENIRDSSPSSDMIVRDELRNVLAALEDITFIDPTNNGTSNVKPASITNGAETIVSTGDDADDVRMDIRALLQKFIDANNPANQAVLIMKESTALALSLMVNTLGNAEFSGMGMRGGMLLGIPVITSEHVPAGIVAVVNASDIHYGDDGEIAVDMSREASLEFKDQANITQNGAAGTGASLVSLWQNNLVGIRAEHTINWRRRRASAVAYLTSVSWGGAVPAS